MNDQEIFETTTAEEANYEVSNDNFELDAFYGEDSDGKDDILKYVGVAAAAIGAFALIERGVKAIGKKIKSKKHAETEDEHPKKKAKEEVIDIEEDELEPVESVEKETEEVKEEQPKKKKK